MKDRHMFSSILITKNANMPEKLNVMIINKRRMINYQL